MGFAEGVVWSLLGAVAHTVIDVLRKFGAQKLPPAGAHTIIGRLHTGPWPHSMYSMCHPHQTSCAAISRQWHA
jgi:hypothetical protein